jgi:hypothetical protein
MREKAVGVARHDVRSSAWKDEMKAYDCFTVINKIIVGVVLWMAAGLFIVVSSGFPSNFLRSPVSWILWCAAAPALAMITVGIAGLIARLVPRAFIDWVMRSTPVGWFLNWILSGEDAIDRMLRVGASALAFLVIFLVAVRLIFGPA